MLAATRTKGTIPVTRHADSLRGSGWVAGLAARPLPVVLALSLVASTLSAQSVCGDSLRVSYEPVTPRNGTLFTVRVAGAGEGIALEGRAGGEPLHFHDAGKGVFESLAAAPIDAESLSVSVVCGAGERADSSVRTLVLARGSYPLEKLRVAPRFSAPPDSALQARLRREAAPWDEVPTTLRDSGASRSRRRGRGA